MNRTGLHGARGFVEGSAHDARDQQTHDRAVRERLEDRGFVVIAILHDRAFAERIAAYTDMFGSYQWCAGRPHHTSLAAGDAHGDTHEPDHRPACPRPRPPRSTLPTAA